MKFPDLCSWLKYTEKYEYQSIWINLLDIRHFITGIVFQINDLKYFAPLSSFKEKHKKMSDSIDFIKIKNYAVINLNNMFPVPEGKYTYVDISKERNLKYKSLLLA